jgi:hypothetical protein
MTDSLSAVARGIGMEIWPPEKPGASWWVDGETAICYVDDPECDGHLRTYLLTGDRPMRIAEKRGIGVEQDLDGIWQACTTVIDSYGFPYRKLGWRSNTPAEAILACALEIVTSE